MYQPHQLPGLFRHKTLDEVHIVPVLPGGYAECGVIIPVINNVLRPEGIAVLLLKLLQRLHGHGCAVSEPIHKLFLCITSEYQGEMIEKCGKPHHIRVRVILQPLYQIFLGKCAGRILSHVKRYLMGLIAPVIGNMVIHLGGIPNGVYEKRHRILMERFCMWNHHCQFSAFPGLSAGRRQVSLHGQFSLHGQIPFLRRQRLPRGPVHDFPPFLRVMVQIRHHLLVKITVHEVNPQPRPYSRVPFRHKVKLLAFIHMLPCKFIMAPCHKIRGINFCIQ